MITVTYDGNTEEFNLSTFVIYIRNSRVNTLQSYSKIDNEEELMFLYSHCLKLINEVRQNKIPDEMKIDLLEDYTINSEVGRHRGNFIFLLGIQDNKIFFKTFGSCVYYLLPILLDLSLKFKYKFSEAVKASIKDTHAVSSDLLLGEI